eukprot:4931118-Amphidinium_carterae.1
MRLLISETPPILPNRMGLNGTDAIHAFFRTELGSGVRRCKRAPMPKPSLLCMTLAISGGLANEVERDKGKMFRKKASMQHHVSTTGS